MSTLRPITLLTLAGVLAVLTSRAVSGEQKAELQAEREQVTLSIPVEVIEADAAPMVQRVEVHR